MYTFNLLKLQQSNGKNPIISRYDFYSKAEINDL